ncbi:MAG TPA: hypothetical protein VFA39_20010 [Steroidobacteraceae bacterium]|nr:hypothetical protein [Steroidobacteraceae bacterium]
MTIPSEDLALIRADGLPRQIDPRYVLLEPDGCVRFTERGRELYRVALLMYGLSPDPVDDVRTKEDLRKLNLKVSEAQFLIAASEAERAMREGKIPARSREIVNAILHGTLEGFHEAVERRIACDAAGQNVVPFPARNRAPRRALSIEESDPGIE